MDFDVNPDCKVCDGAGTEAFTGGYSGITHIVNCGECSGADAEYRAYLKAEFPEEYKKHYF